MVEGEIKEIFFLLELKGIWVVIKKFCGNVCCKFKLIFGFLVLGICLIVVDILVILVLVGDKVVWVELWLKFL